MNKNNTPKKASLGRGLSSLLGENKQSINNVLSDHKQLSTIIIPIELITPGPWQARKNFDKKELENLALSIKTNGIIQPILVKTDELNSGKYLIL